MDPGRLSIALKRADGRVERLGGDEALAENVPTGLTATTTNPGGFGTFNVSVTRDPAFRDIDPLDELVVYGPGNEVAWEGYGIAFPASKGDQTRVDLSAVGWQASMKDDVGFKEIYVDRDPSGWVDPATSRRIALNASGWNVDGANRTDGTDPPTISLAHTGQITKPNWGIDYDAGPGLLISRVYVPNHSLIGLSNHAADVNTNEFIYGFDDDAHSVGLISTSDVSGLSAFDWILPTAKRFIGLNAWYSGTSAGATGIEYGVRWGTPVVYGNHGLSIQGTMPGGLFDSDIVADILRRAAPQLRVTQGTELLNIWPSAVVVPHLVFRDFVSADEAVLEASKYSFPDWGVYEGRQAFWRPPGTGRTWVVREDDRGVSFSDHGPQADDDYNGVIVQYTDAAGRTKTVGPPGSSTDAQDALLADTSESNQLNRHGRRRWKVISVGGTTYGSKAIEIGAVWLRETLAINDAGECVITGEVQDLLGNVEPVWKVRAADQLIIASRDWRSRRIVETTYTHDGRRLSASLDSAKKTLDAFQERLNVALEGVVT